MAERQERRAFAGPRGSNRLLSLSTAALLMLAACGGSGSSAGVEGGSGGATQILRVQYGQLVDVFGLTRGANGTASTLYRTDVLIGTDIQDERPNGSSKRDDEILFDFISANPDTLQPRLLITREIGTPAFDEAIEKLGVNLRQISAMEFGQNTPTQPFTAVPRNAALRIVFSRNVGVGDDFFVERDANGRVVGVKNTDAVQLLKIVGDPRDNEPGGDFEVIPTRVSVRDNELIVDPVLLGTEGLQYNTRNNAAGMPESPNRIGANIRLALAFEGRNIPGIKPVTDGKLTGLNNSGQQSVIRDFRSGNRDDESSDLSQGFLRDAIPPRIVGQVPMFLERVEARDEFTQVVTVYKGGAVHEIDSGDVLRFFTDNSGVPVASAEVVEDPADDYTTPAEQHVRCIVRRTAGLSDIDPSKRPDYPSSQTAREPWLIANAPQAVLIAEFTAERSRNGQSQGDRAEYFLRFTPAPLPNTNGTPSPSNQNVSPFAGAIVQFTKPVDLTTVKGLDTLFFGTRDLLDEQAIELFRTTQQIDKRSFRREKFVTPHLVDARVFDEDGSQTAIRLQPSLGFYLDETIRELDEGTPFEDKQFKYYLHVLGGQDGIKDLSGNSIDFQSQTSVRDQLTIPFSLDTRRNKSDVPLFPDNLTVTIARRYAGEDEDEQPSYYIPDEIQDQNSSETNDLAFNLRDVVGSVIYLPDGRLTARPAGRVRRAADDLNQQPAPPQSTEARFCPFEIGNQEQVVVATATRRFGSPIQNPLNPFGCRLQMLWREIDLNMSRTDTFDLNLDVEQAYWAPFAGSTITYDEFDEMSLYLGHSERRPEPCLGQFSALPSMVASGLVSRFESNFVTNFDLNRIELRDEAPKPFPAFLDQSLTILSSLVVLEPNNTYRYLPLPEFEKNDGPGDPYFVWRDERMMLQGADSGVGFDTGSGRNNSFVPYIRSPYAGGQGWPVKKDGNGGLEFENGFWDNRRNYWPGVTSQLDQQTDGLVGAASLPLLGDFWVKPDSDKLPVGNPFLASGANGWQIAIPVGSAPTPNFRVYSGGGLVNGKPRLVAPTTRDWDVATGGYTPTGQRTRPGDNSFYWMMFDFQKRLSVATAGFVDILNPHRMDPNNADDPRLGPYFDGTSVPSGTVPRFSYTFEPPLDSLPPGTSVVPEFRATGEVDPNPWAYQQDAGRFGYKPTRKNFALNPLTAGDAHIRKYDDRNRRNGWTYYYNKNVTDYVEDPNTLMDRNFLAQFGAPNEAFLPRDVKFINWRMIMENNVEATPATSPTIESFSLTYRFERQGKLR